ncbi:ammonia-dependent NAD(+) synthetase [Candidatus Saccharibacteria bacterium]|nr:MAG: ammonia-dependent NAD(+) synthetase [Candidatus Saccharibacteria bacterium]
MCERQHEIITTLGVKPSIEPKEEIERRTRQLADYLRENSKAGFVLGVSGGQDSLLVGLLAQRAAVLSRAEGYTAQFCAMLLPYGDQSDRLDAELAINVIKPDRVIDFNIKPMVDAFATTYDSATMENLTDFHKGNAKARSRMVAQYALAGMHNMLVLGTDHAAEALVGFFTKFGDGAADVAPISTLNKRQGRQLLRYLGVPEVFTSKAPTADLLDGTPSQPDETELGLTYSSIDDYLEGKEMVDTIATVIERKYDATAHKRENPVAF